MAECIEREAAMTVPVLPKEYRTYRAANLDDAYEAGWNDALENLRNIPAAENVLPVVRCAACRHRTEPKCNKADYAAREIAKCGCTKSPCYWRLVYLTEFCSHGEREEDA